MILALVILLILAKWAAQLWLEGLNQREALARAQAAPEAFKEVMDPETYAKAVQYTLARGRLSRFEETCGAVVLLLALLSGALPAGYDWFVRHAGGAAWAMSAFLCATAIILAAPELPIQWYEQFRLEQRFGFNSTSQRTWWLDRVKALVLALVLGYPLLALTLKLVEWTGAWWWLWAWTALLMFQAVMMALAPALILPLFNKFTPLPEGGLRDRLVGLANRANFRARSIQLMDGSRRSSHSNAFFTGFGRFRKIVLFDTLARQLSETELEAVVAHEIGHYKKRHILKMLVWSAAGSLAGFWIVGMLARQADFYRAFGFEPGNVAVALLLFALLAGTVTFWLSPIFNAWSRRYEYEADAFAAAAMNETHSLTAALRKLTEKNLSNLTPHPIYSAFHYSHPTLLERERALKKGIEAGGRT